MHRKPFDVLESNLRIITKIPLIMNIQQYELGESPNITSRGDVPQCFPNVQQQIA